LLEKNVVQETLHENSFQLIELSLLFFQAMPLNLSDHFFTSDHAQTILENNLNKLKQKFVLEKKTNYLKIKLSLV
jgi:hypothetical protein